MKRIFTQITMVMMTLAMGMTLTSCDEDVDQAYDLNGTWEGWIRTTRMSDRFNDYTEDWETTIIFEQDGDFSRGGYGIEYDYSPRGHRYVNEFEWRVRNGRIYIRYDDGSDIVIDRYSQTSNRFSGIFCDARTYEDIASFQLIKTSDNRYWANTRSANAKASGSDSTQVALPADSVRKPRE